jgi:hypothetical protein
MSEILLSRPEAEVYMDLENRRQMWFASVLKSRGVEGNDRTFRVQMIQDLDQCCLVEVKDGDDTGGIPGSERPDPDA